LSIEIDLIYAAMRFDGKVPEASGELRDGIGRRYLSAGRIISMDFGMAIIGMGVPFALRFWGVVLW